MSDDGRSLSAEVPSPDQREVPDPGLRYDSMQVLQSLIEIQKDISVIATKTDRLISDVDKLEKKLDKRIDELDGKMDKLSHAFSCSAAPATTTRSTWWPPPSSSRST